MPDRPISDRPLPPPEDLDRYLATYDDDPFERENLLTIEAHLERCVRYATPRGRYLELGIGHGVALARLAEAMHSVLVLDGSAAIVQRYRGRHPNVEIRRCYFEQFDSDERFAAIGMGFVLEHVDDPALVLRKYGAMLAPGGSIFVGVPNAASLHRRIGHAAGLLDDMHAMTEVDLAFGHKRLLSHAGWMELFAAVGFEVVRAEGLYLKPFSQAQLDSLGLGPAVYRALVTLASDYPELANSCFYQLHPAEAGHDR